jgi:HAD superfamily hydrolase (TIGR01509 family)
MGLSALIFDVDGTLAETEELHRRAFNAAFEEAGLPWHWDRPLYGDLLKVTGGKERIARYMTLRGGDVDPGDQTRIAELHRRKTELYNHAVQAGSIALRPGIVALLEAATSQGVRLAIATTTSSPNVDSLLSTTIGARWTTMFPVVAAGDMVARKKPAPDVYEMALAGLGLRGGDCLALEDSRNGLLSALAADVATVVTVSEYTRHEEFEGALAVGTDLPTLAGSADGSTILDALRRLHERARVG